MGVASGDDRVPYLRVYYRCVGMESFLDSLRATDKETY